MEHLCLWWSKHAGSPCEDEMEAFLDLSKDVFRHFIVECQAGIPHKKMEHTQAQAAGSGVAATDAPAGPESVQVSLLAVRRVPAVTSMSTPLSVATAKPAPVSAGLS